VVGRARDRSPVVSLGIFSVVPPTEPCALRSTQPLNVITRDFSWGKGGRCVWLTTYHPCSVETSRKSRVLTYPEPFGPPLPVAGDLYFTLYIYIYIYIHTHTHTTPLFTLSLYKSRPQHTVYKKIRAITIKFRFTLCGRTRTTH